MTQHTPEDFETLEAILNWSPETPFASVGEVEKHLAYSIDTLDILDKQTVACLAGLESAAAACADSFGLQSIDVLNLVATASFVTALHMGNRIPLERDILVMTSFVQFDRDSDE